ncbi:ABC transporter ATP-binding protein [Desulfosporosinus meridiei]|uniref:ABC-type cobalamin/Fe3+-siderophore transport system, ATPase component n=1 Tax=Desulfosporosinus meridiei (strain ATCC BAA-275 / DSM 13257 / KCTC 12902 / NCIMB 13706 / S10) TaxID=768704 RepID=J7IV63_DESMD|nr:ABC transporter ATP-binding protein [Desulfosporosinus meridiei]AFQ42596.1 ABC-type cobalamin/Fe3+-siderophore transport system, ATPase component [Desulfosporosinus meridiei DSM 13257]
MTLQVESLSFSYDHKAIIEDICLNVKKGEFVGLIGPNGSGKSTILKNLYRALQPDRGEVKLDGENLFKLTHKQAATKIGVVGQENALPFDFKVEEIVAMGRSPHKKLFAGDSPEDKEIVRQALAYLRMEDMAKKNYLKLSGGEKQRVLIARAIAQKTDFLILDEPTNHLDIGYQLQILDFVKRLQATVLTAIHDLNIAALYCDRIYVLKEGKIYTRGTAEEVLTPEIIFEVYGIKADVIIHPFTQKISITFLPQSLNNSKRALKEREM